MEHYDLIVMELIRQHSYIGLFVALILGIIGLPVPDEFLLTFAGMEIRSGRMNFPLTWIIAFVGSLAGMSISYCIGRLLGAPFFDKIAPYLHLNEKRRTRIESWFALHGVKLVFVGYFLPGIRHISAYFAGISKTAYPKFVVYAGGGALFWSLTFLTLGRFLGRYAPQFNHLLHYHLLHISIIVAILGLVVYAVYRFAGKKRISD